MDFKESYSRLTNMKQVKKLPQISKSYNVYDVEHINQSDFIIKINMKDICIEDLRFFFSKNEFKAKTNKGIIDMKYLKNTDIIPLFINEKHFDVFNSTCDVITSSNLIYFRTNLHNEAFLNMLKDGYLTLKNIELTRYYDSLKEGLNYATYAKIVNSKNSVFCNFYSEHAELAEWLVQNTSFATSSRFNESFIYCFATLVESYGEDIAKYFAESYNKSSVEYRTFRTYLQYDRTAKDKFTVNAFKSILQRVGDVRRFIDYSLFEIYTQGFKLFDGTTYSFYLGFIEKNKKLNNGTSHFSKFSQHYKSDTEFAAFWNNTVIYKEYKDKNIRKVGKYKFIEPCDDYYHATGNVGFINTHNGYLLSWHIYNVYIDTEKKFLGIVGEGFIYPEKEEFRDELSLAWEQLYKSFTQKEKVHMSRYFRSSSIEEVCPNAGKPLYKLKNEQDANKSNEVFPFCVSF